MSLADESQKQIGEIIAVPHDIPAPEVVLLILIMITLSLEHVDSTMATADV